MPAILTADGHYGLLIGILRNKWGFNGFAITDNSNTGVFMDVGQMIQAGSLSSRERQIWRFPLLLFIRQTSGPARCPAPVR